MAWLNRIFSLQRERVIFSRIYYELFAEWFPDAQFCFAQFINLAVYTEQIANHNGTEVEESMDVEAGQFEDAEEEP